MKLIFLDVDGVLNMFGSSCRTFMKPHGQHIEPHLAQRLNYICERITDLRIVISSSWRSDMDDLQTQLEEQGFKHWNRVVGKTPKPYREHLDYDKPAKILLDKRGEQINEWIKCRDFKGRFLVIDDEICDIKSHINSQNIKEIDMMEGMLHKDVIEIIHFFNQDLK